MKENRITAIKTEAEKSTQKHRTTMKQKASKNETEIIKLSP